MIYREPFLKLDPLEPIFYEKGGRDLFVGDIHGQWEMFQRLLELCGYEPGLDRIICTGDLIDKGPDGARLVRWFSTHPDHVCVMGNHEAMLVDAEGDSVAWSLWQRQDNRWADLISKEELNVLRRLVQFFPMAVEVPLTDGRRVGVVHAEVPPGMSWGTLATINLLDPARSQEYGTTASALLWGRRRAMADFALRMEATQEDLGQEEWDLVQSRVAPIEGIDLVVAGHSPTDDFEPSFRGNQLWIDTGAFLPSGRLTMVDLIENVYWQIGRKTKHGKRHLRSA